jgi:hypothetical protein
MLKLTLLQFAHVLGFVYWLGVDTAVYYTSRYAVDRTLSPETRVTSIRILFAIDLIPRICMTMVLPLGLQLAWKLGLVAVPAAALAAIWLICFAWLGMVLFLHFRHGSPKHGTLTKFDFYFRIVVILALTAYALLSLTSDSGAKVDWVAWKLLIFAGLMSCGLMIRIMLKPFGPAFGRLVAGQASEEDDAAISASIASTRPWVLVIWLGLFTSAWLGISSI